MENFSTNVWKTSWSFLLEISRWYLWLILNILKEIGVAVSAEIIAWTIENMLDGCLRKFRIESINPGYVGQTAM